MTKILVKWKNETGYVFEDKGYRGRKEVGMVDKIEGGLLCALMHDGTSFVAETMTSLKKQIMDHLFEESQKLVTVKNLMNDKSVQIRAELIGGICDPSTERYWSA